VTFRFRFFQFNLLHDIVLSLRNIWRSGNFSIVPIVLSLAPNLFQSHLLSQRQAVVTNFRESQRPAKVIVVAIVALISTVNGPSIDDNNMTMNSRQGKSRASRAIYSRHQSMAPFASTREGNT
jgi:hypothetical protein